MLKAFGTESIESRSLRKFVAELTVSADVDVEKAKRLIERAEEVCLVTNSLKAKIKLEAHLLVG